MPALEQKIVKGTTSPHWWITNGIEKNAITSTTAAGLVFSGFATWDNGAPFVLDQAIVNDIVTV